MRVIAILSILVATLAAQTGKTAAEQGISYEQFQAMHKTEKRSVERFKEAIKPIEKELIDFWNGIPEENRPDTIQIIVNINGIASVYGYTEKNITSDSTRLSKMVTNMSNLDSILKKCSLPFISKSVSFSCYALNFNKTGTITYPSSEFYFQPRTRQNIAKTVLKNSRELKMKYIDFISTNKHLRGKITTKFAIDEFGKVLFVKLLANDMEERDNADLNAIESFEKVLVSTIAAWEFGKIMAPGDVTEVVYPFIFAPF